MPALVWALAIRSIFAVIFGLVALVWPGVTLLALVLLFGVYAFVGGTRRMVCAFYRESGARHLIPHLLLHRRVRLTRRTVAENYPYPPPSAQP